ncbi:MAG TPA: FGGY family carbohydrate kinase [Clostridiales bacterium]|nr:FGGY family carbohydrate kinase [Clostridiales bacterium]HQK73623.1 FGGY family carbohydrate kinase [Clostridiales bacterium]
MRIIGLDVGTTTVCAAVIDAGSGEMLRSVTRPNAAALTSVYPFERIQDPAVILGLCEKMAGSLIGEYGPIAAIGVTGQMHGIVYLDRRGDAVSPLHYWQDESGNEPYRNSTYAAYLSGVTGYKMASGFGGTTFFYHTVNNRVPQGATVFCTIHDYVAMKLAGAAVPLSHVSDAASFGLFDLDRGGFDRAAAAKAGLDDAFFPQVTDRFEILGEYRGIPVTVAVGDNQASYLGCVRDTGESVLVNIGTGGQVSYLTESPAPVSGLEIRPCYTGHYLAVGSSLCGGRAFALLENFLRESAALVTGGPACSAYPAIDRYLAENPPPADALDVSTKFSGTRENPGERGFIKNIGTGNFTPGHLIWGVLGGICGELLEMYRAGGAAGHTKLVGSGNGLRKNPALQKLFAERFALPLLIPRHSEEAAFGAALTAMAAAGISKDITQAQKIIEYR